MQSYQRLEGVATVFPCRDFRQVWRGCGPSPRCRAGRHAINTFKKRNYDVPGGLASTLLYDKSSCTAPSSRGRGSCHSAATRVNRAAGLVPKDHPWSQGTGARSPPLWFNLASCSATPYKSLPVKTFHGTLPRKTFGAGVVSHWLGCRMRPVFTLAAQ